MALGVMLLNPWISDVVIQHLTTENIYWRLFYLLPFPLMPALALGLVVNAGRIGAALTVLIVSITGFSHCGAYLGAQARERRDTINTRL